MILVNGRHRYAENMRPFLEDYANWDGPTTICLTVDIDWAPEYMIRYLFDILDQYDARATIFATHDSALLHALADEGRFEIGHHLYLGKGSDQGEDVEHASAYLRSLYPQARGNRFHLLEHSYRDLQGLADLGYEYDVSTLRFNCPYLVPAWHGDLRLVLLSYFWEDGISEQCNIREDIETWEPGTKVLNFHPLNVYLNSKTAERRRALLRKNPALLDCPESEARKYRCPTSEHGAEVILRSLLEQMREHDCTTGLLWDLARSFKKCWNGHTGNGLCDTGSVNDEG